MSPANGRTNGPVAGEDHTHQSDGAGLGSRRLHNLRPNRSNTLWPSWKCRLISAGRVAPRVPSGEGSSLNAKSSQETAHTDNLTLGLADDSRTGATADHSGHC